MVAVGLVHSTRLVVEPVHQVLTAQCPGVEFFHVMDEGILRALSRFGRINAPITDWLGRMVASAVDEGAALIVVTCSSLSPCVNAIREQTRVPVLKIDEPMVEAAVSAHGRIGLVMTNPTTEKPSQLLIAEVSRRLAKPVTVVPHLCTEAFAKLNRGDIAGHDADVAHTIQSMLNDVDVVLLAQISIARIIDQIDPRAAPRVLSSLQFIAPQIKALLA
jgi:glutamate racemase